MDDHPSIMGKPCFDHGTKPPDIVTPEVSHHGSGDGVARHRGVLVQDDFFADLRARGGFLERLRMSLKMGRKKGLGIDVPLCFTSPHHWGYNLQQIFEGDVQNPQKGTFTDPCGNSSDFGISPQWVNSTMEYHHKIGFHHQRFLEFQIAYHGFTVGILPSGNLKNGEHEHHHCWLEKNLEMDHVQKQTGKLSEGYNVNPRCTWRIIPLSNPGDRKSPTVGLSHL